MIYFDDDTRFAVREFDLMKSGKLNHKGRVQLHEAYMVRKYLILILDFVEGKTLLDQFKGRHSATEDDVAFIIGELCETLNFLHQQNIVHLDLRPTNIRFEGRDIKLLDYNSSRHLANKKAGTEQWYVLAVVERSRRDWAGLLSVKDIDVYDVEWHAMRCLSSCVIVS